MNHVMAALGIWLQIKPLLKMHDGSPTAERICTFKAATQRLIALLQEQGPLERAALVHNHALQKAQQLRQKAQHLLPEGEILSVNITPVFGVHLARCSWLCVCQQVSKYVDNCPTFGYHGRKDRTR